MQDITNENKLKAGWDIATKLGGKVIGAAKDAATYPFQKKGFTNPVDATTAKNMSSSARTQADIAALQKSKIDAVRSDKFTPDQLDDIDRKISNLKSTQRQIDIDNFGARKGKGGTDVPNIPDKIPTPDKFRSGQQIIRKGTVPALAVGGVEAGYRQASSSEANPAGDSLTGLAADTIGQGVRSIVKAPFQAAGSALTNPDAVKAAAQEEPADTNTDYANIPAKESIADILKLSGQRPITERDSTSGLVKVKAITTLTESQDLAECGGMMSAPTSMPHTPATISINATAGSGEEVANMLASIMKLAGVREVTPNMLGGDQMPMPVLKSLDIISRADDDSMNGMDDMSGIEVVGGDEMTHHDHDHEHKDFEGELEEQGEEYANAPADPTKVPAFDSNKMADMRNYIDMAEIPAGAPGDNRLPKEEEQIRETKTVDLFQAYQSYKNGQ